MSSLGNIFSSIPDVNGVDFSSQKEIKELKNYMAMLTKQLQYALNNLEPEENFTEAAYEEWESKVTNGYVTSLIRQTEEEILLTVSKTYAKESEVQSAIQQTADNILMSVSAKYATAEAVTQMESRINVSINGITSTVSTKVGKDEIISRINQSAESVTISANKINLDGPTIANSLTVHKGSSALDIMIMPGYIQVGKDASGDMDIVLSAGGGLEMYDDSTGRGIEVRVRPSGIEMEETKGSYPRYRTRMYADGIIKERKQNASSGFTVIWSAGE